MTPGLPHYNTRVLIVDDQDTIHEDFAEMLQPASVTPDFDVVADTNADMEAEAPFLPKLELLHANTGEQACSIVSGSKEANRPIAVAYIDVRMPPGIDGVETIRRVRKIDRDVEIVVMTAYSDRSLPEIVRDLDALHKLLYIRKPFVHEEIQQTTLSLVGKWNAERDLAEEQRELVGRYRRLEALLDATGDAIALLDGAGRRVFANRAYKRILGLGDAEMQQIAPDVLTALVDERLREPDPSDVEARFLIDSSDVADAADTGPGPVPKQRLFHRSSVPVHDGAGEEIGRLEVYRDVALEIEADRRKADVLHLRGTPETGHSFAGMAGASPRMRQVYALMQQAAEADVTVLVRGEPGTGTELVSRSFHRNSLRKEGPFVVVDCGATPEAFIESELFGGERGTPAGATAQRVGAFERADGGTVLLDRIEAVPYTVQRELLRVLLERTIRRVGGDALIRVDVRVITATSKDLERAVMAGEFREDLLYRLAAFPIVIPPLRERKEDVPVLARHLLERHAARAGKSITGISYSAMRLLLQYDWPGNVRELEDAMGRAVRMEQTEVLQAGSLPPPLSPIAALGGGHVRAAPGAAVPGAAMALEEAERLALSHALQAAGHNVKQAAEALGISRATLYRKLKKHGVMQ